MLAWIIALVLGFIGVVMALAAGELRYEKPHQYPLNQRFGVGIAIILLTLALATARYL